MPPKRSKQSCPTAAHPICGEQDFPSSRQDSVQELSDRVRCILGDQHVAVSSEEQDRFIDFLSLSLRHRRIAAQVWARIQDEFDIIRLVQQARDEGDLDEAVWRSFLAAHFGRASASSAHDSQIRSASWLLCGFGSAPSWTWRRVSDNPATFRKWLVDHSDDLKQLAYGNHRKYESKRAEGIWEVMESFVTLAGEFGGPSRLITVDRQDASDSEDEFDVIYRRLKPIPRFGRTGCFDLLVLLIDLNMISAQPKSCYLRGATGPRIGASKLWGKRPISELEELAEQLAGQLGISPIALEDALCNWQK